MLTRTIACLTLCCFFCLPIPIICKVWGVFVPCLNLELEMALLLGFEKFVPELDRTALFNLNPMLFSSLLLLLLLFFLLLFSLKLTGRDKYNLPPSPPRLPIIGNLHQVLGILPHRALHALSIKYGPLMFLHLGHTPTLVVSSAEMAREMMKTDDIIFSNRPKTTAANIFVYGCKDVGFTPYGEYWRQVRKICVLELLSPKRVKSFHSVREEEVAAFINIIRRRCSTGGSVNLSEMLLAVSNNIVARCVLGRKADEEEGKSKFGELSRRLMEQFVEFCVGDMFPSLGWIDFLTGLIGRLKATSREFDALLDQVIKEHKISECEDGQSDNRDFVSILLQLQKDGRLGIELTQESLKAIIMDMFVGGEETTSTTIEWAMAELVRDPNPMKKVQEEVRNVVKRKLKIDMNDINRMDYLKSVIKETLRLHAPTPLLVPRETSASVKLGGYDIPAKTSVYVNAWAIHRDPKHWDRPEEFYPERILNSPVDWEGQNFQFIPFGGGRRGCPGMSFGVATTEYVMANLLYWFDWKVLGEESLDMSEAYGLTVHKKFPLHLVPVSYSP